MALALSGPEFRTDYRIGIQSGEALVNIDYVAKYTLFTDHLRLVVVGLDPVRVAGLAALALLVDGVHRLRFVGSDSGLGGELFYVSPVILQGVAMLEFVEACVGFDNPAVETEVAAFEHIVFEVGLQNDFQSGLVNLSAETNLDSRKRGAVVSSFAKIVVEEGEQQEDFFAAACEGALAGKVFEEADHEHLEENRRGGPPDDRLRQSHGRQGDRLHAPLRRSQCFGTFHRACG